MDKNITFTVLLTAAYLFWPISLILGIMLLGGPNAQTPKNIVTTVAVLAYPIYLTAILLIFKWKYFGLHPLLHLLIVATVVVAGLWIMGFLRP